KIRIRSGDHFSVLASPWGKKIEFDKEETVPALNFLLFITVILATLIFFLLAHRTADLLTVNLYFVLILFAAFLYAYAGSEEKIFWLEELTDGLLTVIFPSILFEVLQPHYLAELTIIGYIFPVFFLFLSFRFVFSMVIINRQNNYSPGFFVYLIRNNLFRIHHLFPSLAFLLIVAANRMGVHWRIQWAQLLVIPTICLQIIYIEKVINGGKPNWKLIEFLAYTNLLLMEYFQNVSVWINSGM
ncbi:MAG: hypothetical protein ABFD07_10620, partial [Methanobacterium sp.]